MLTPLEIQKIEFKKTIGGYQRADVDEMFMVLSGDYEALYKENIRLKDKLEVLEGIVERYKGMEETMQSTLIVAQKAADDLAKSAAQNAETIIAKAEHEADIIRQDARMIAAETVRNIECTRRDILSYSIQVDSILDAQKKLVAKILDLRSDNNGLRSDIESAEDSVSNEGVASAERA